MSLNNRRIALLGANAALGNRSPACREAAGILLNWLIGGRVGIPLALARRQPIIAPDSGDPEQDTVVLCNRIAARIRCVVSRGRPFVFCSGDHSQAMGLWRGVRAGLGQSRRLGILWIDAHLDAHTGCTSPSQKLHGMPVAGLLGADDRVLKNICGVQRVLEPWQICLVGGHSFEDEERRWLDDLGVAWFGMRDIRRRGLATVLRYAWRQLARRCDRIGISLDLDAIDPVDAPGVALPSPGGVRADELRRGLSGLPRPIGLEIAEYNPAADERGRTLSVIADIVRAVYDKPSGPNRSLGSSGR